MNNTRRPKIDSKSTKNLDTHPSFHTKIQKEMLFYYCNPTDDMQITIYIQKPGHDCWSGEAIYKGGSAFASSNWRKQVSRTGVGGSKQGS